MKRFWIVLCLLVAAAAAMVGVFGPIRAVLAPAGLSLESMPPVADKTFSAVAELVLQDSDRIVVAAATEQASAEAVWIETPKAPVQPLEERGDAVLFDIGALSATPFDEAILFPFD